jgi:hypothetical protein
LQGRAMARPCNTAPRRCAQGIKNIIMAILKGKHNISEIDGIRCTVIETGATPERVEFLKNLLAFNGYEVKMEKEKAKDGTELETFVIGLTDILFNPMIVLYEKKLIRKDGLTVTPSYWNQLPDQDALPYWQVQR